LQIHKFLCSILWGQDLIASWVVNYFTFNRTEISTIALESLKTHSFDDVSEIIFKHNNLRELVCMYFHAKYQVSSSQKAWYQRRHFDKGAELWWTFLNDNVWWKPSHNLPFNLQPISSDVLIWSHDLITCFNLRTSPNGNKKVIYLITLFTRILILYLFIEIVLKSRIKTLKNKLNDWHLH